MQVDRNEWLNELMNELVSLSINVLYIMISKRENLIGGVAAGGMNKWMNELMNEWLGKEIIS